MTNYWRQKAMKLFEVKSIVRQNGASGHRRERQNLAIRYALVCCLRVQ